MSINPIEDNSTPKATGSLEELFRHHLGEEAAVPTRPMLWDQIDNSLLIRQNETYRRRLAATRWVAAASLLLATLAGTGWWAGRTDGLGGSEMAANRQSNNSATYSSRNPDAATSSANRATTTPYGPTAPLDASVATAPSAASGMTGTSRGINSTAEGLSVSGNAGRPATSGSYGSVASARPAGAGTAEQYTNHSSVQARRGSANSAVVANENIASNGVKSAERGAFNGIDTDVPTSRESQGLASNHASVDNTASEGTSEATADRVLVTSGVAATGIAAATTTLGETVAGASIAAGSTTLAASSAAMVAPEQIGLLATRQPVLNLTDAAGLPNGLATVNVPVEEPAAIDAHRWHYGASYTASSFNPNVDFSRAGIAPEFDYNHGAAFGPNSPALTEGAATEYRDNLRPGLSQRIALLATRHLRSHWSLSTGAEFTQATAKSATATAFVGEQLFDLGQPITGQPLRTTDFRYRMASIPLEVRYSNPVKRGWSLYGRLGGVVTALLGVRSDVEGDPEATRTYSITSGGMPYRRVMGSLRGGAGTQFRTSTGKWAFTMGPVAEIGLVSMNAHPVQSYFAQSRPYSFGIEAGVEFGR